MENSMRFLKKLKTELYDPAIPLLGTYVKECKQDTIETLVHIYIIYIYIYIYIYTYTHNGILFSHKEE
jgi:hypothetical protein